DAVAAVSDAAPPAPAPAGPSTSSGTAPASAPAASQALRRGLPRTPGGEPWPPAGAAAVVSSATAPAAAAADDSSPVAPRGREATETKRSGLAATAVVATARTAASVATEDGPALRRGLPRTPGGEPWPPAGAVARRASVAEPVQAPETSVTATVAEP